MLETIHGRYTIKQIFEDEHRHWERFREKHGASIRPAIVEAVEKVLACRNPERMGYHRYRCPTPGCFSERIVPHSCKSRFCSSCGKVMTDRWMERAGREFLDVPYYHLVFTIPQELRNVFAWDRKLLGVLFYAAKTTVLEWCRREAGYIPGIAAVQHTFGSDLKFNPHIHMLITEGGLSPDRTRWIHNEFIPWKMLKARWKYHVVMGIRPRLREMIAERHIGSEYRTLGVGRPFRRFLGDAVSEDLVCVDGDAA